MGTNDNDILITHVNNIVSSHLKKYENIGSYTYEPVRDVGSLKKTIDFKIRYRTIYFFILINFEGNIHISISLDGRNQMLGDEIIQIADFLKYFKQLNGSADLKTVHDLWKGSRLSELIIVESERSH